MVMDPVVVKFSRFKIAHHRHSGRLRPHEFTSYFPLGVLLLVVGISLAICTVYAASPGPESSSIGLSGGMPGPAPKIAAVITSPSNNQHFSTTPVPVKGTCPDKTLVEIYKNDIFAGSAPCSDTGSFSIDIDLLIGQNKLIARVYDNNNQAGPDSNTVIAFYDALPAQAGALSSLNFSGTQMLLNTDAVFRGAFPDQSFNVPLTIIGGTPPYAVNVQWGDSSNKVLPRNDNVTFNADHKYKKAGTYQMSIQATDSQQRVAFLTVAAIVNGQPPVAVSGTATNKPVNKLLALWPLYTSAVAIVISFWLGERREKKILNRGPVYLPAKN